MNPAESFYRKKRNNIETKTFKILFIKKFLIAVS